MQNFPFAPQEFASGPSPSNDTLPIVLLIPIARRRWRLPRSGDSLVDDDYSYDCSLPPSPPTPTPTPASRPVGSISRSPQLRAAHCHQGPGRRRQSVLLPGGRPLRFPFVSFRREFGTARARGDAATVSSPVLLDPAVAHRRQAGGTRSARLAGSAISI